MYFKIKNRIEKELNNYICRLDKAYSLKKISPVLFKYIKDFISREGKRLRPILFIIGYLGYSKRTPPGLYKTAVSLELLHDFMLVHDDIIDKSDTRRGKPSMHAMLNRYLKNRGRIKFNGQDLTIVIGDVMFAMALDAFLSVREDMHNKERSLKKLIEAALYTGSGEFIELLYGMENIERISKKEIYKIYDYKTANYTFSSPLTMGAILAGAEEKETKKIFEYGIKLGRAFQIKDDILGVFGTKRKIGKSNLTDLQEEKKTILIWHAYRNCPNKDKKKIKSIFSKRNINKNDLVLMRRLISSSGALKYAQNEINKLFKEAEISIRSSSMKDKYKDFLIEYTGSLLKKH